MMLAVVRQVVIAFLMLLMPFTARGYSQETTGTILGALVDQRGAVHPGVKVVIANVDTGQTREVVTNDSGQYTASLPVGNYEISFLLPNFQFFTVDQISLHVNDRLQVNGHLNIVAVDTLTVTIKSLGAPFAVKLFRTGATIEAFATAARSEALSREHLRLTVRTLPERQALAYASARPSTRDLMLSLASTRSDDSQMSRAAWDAVIRARGMILDEVAARHRSVSAGEAKETAELAEALASARQRLAALTMRGIRNDPPARYRRLLEQAPIDKDRTERALAEHSAKFRDDQLKSRINLPEVSAALPSKSALVGFVRYRRQDLENTETIATAGADAESAYLALVLPAGGVPRTELPYLYTTVASPVVVPLGSAARIDRLVLQWRRQLDQQAMAPAGMGTNRGEAAYRRVAGELRQQIWDPLLTHLSDATRVFIVPDGALHLVSFAALPTASSRYLVETGPVIHYVSAERDLVPTEAGRLSGRGLLVLGGPAFDESTLRPVSSAASFRGTRSTCRDFQSIRFDPLPASLKEVDELLALWNRAHTTGGKPAQLLGVMPSTPDTIRLTGVAASEAAFKMEAGGRRILHLATHGFFLGGRCASALDSSSASTPAELSTRIARENPLLLSGLILAGANHRNVAAADQEDGVLTAEEVAALNLGGVEWAVLSGCNTGVGEIRGSEGVFGLRRAFQVAGARTVIMSLWAVEDQSTRRWMRALYEGRLMKKLSTADAMREASLAVLRQRRAQGLSAHPFYWAGFVAAGDWQ